MSAAILVVDDEVSVLNALGSQLESAGYIVLTATSGNEGLKICKAHHPDVVILDIFMPGMQGNRVAEEIRNNPQTTDIPIVFITSLLTKREIPPDNLPGEQYFIAKPFKFEELHNLLKRIIGNECPDAERRT